MRFDPEPDHLTSFERSEKLYPRDPTAGHTRLERHQKKNQRMRASIGPRESHKQALYIVYFKSHKQTLYIVYLRESQTDSVYRVSPGVTDSVYRVSLGVTNRL
ncbi:hypothetical protein RRG08_010378 [Elysia crispata]|uniref:Uncharacterized protein n=1 Tax=Elysia crispata TaxID=231223 RepID=A0AAE1ED70_9GAST|nr:hypothetical protein RRG08_010378 [Elysia crispata]